MRLQRAVGLVDEDEVGELDDPALQPLQLVAGGRRQDQHEHVGHLGDCGFGLADPDALMRESAQDGPPQPETIVEQNADVALVERALLQLPMHLRAAATLRFIEGRSHPEIAEILNQPIGTVKSHVHRAVRILRRILGPQIGRIVSEGEPAHALS